MNVLEAPALEHPSLTLRRRTSDVASAAAYVVAGLPLALVELIVLLPTLLVQPGVAWRIAALERRVANSLLHARIPPLPDSRSGGRIGSVVQLISIRVPVAAAAAAIAAVPLALATGLLWLGAEALGGSDRYIGPWALETPVGIALLLLAAAAVVVGIAVVEGLASPLRRLARRFLLLAAAGGVAIREALAESIGDATLSIVYWLPDRAAYVDEHGLPVELPNDDSQRAYTVVEHEGRRVAAIVHDAELDARPELVRAAAAGAVLALDNERLKAALRARVEELRASRARIVEASLEARKNLERDLHDGAQQQLVALSLELQMIRGRIGDDGGRELVDGAIARLATALEELRELARGIHPGILTQRGVGAAVASLVDRTPIVVDLEIELEERVTAAAEAAAYFVVAEALTNVAKYARAERAAVRVRREPDAITVEIMDDGVGGADPARGSGLRGLEDRVSALDGVLAVTSPPGEGTTVFARLPAQPV